jgi:rhodanese-related sulfurtransferase
MFEIPEIDVTELHLHREKHILVDVREPHELTGPEGQIEGILLMTLGSRFAHFLRSADPEQSYVFICRSGHRSAHACEIAQVYGFRKVFNMKGGMLAWNQALMDS